MDASMEEVIVYLRNVNGGQLSPCVGRDTTKGT